MTVKDWQSILISRETPILEALRTISESTLQIALVVDETMHLLGTVTDGDVRDGLLDGRELTDPVSEVMCADPTVGRADDTEE